PTAPLAPEGGWRGAAAGGGKLPLVHLQDVVGGLVAAATRPDVCGSIFHLVDAPPVSQRDYIDRCRQESGGTLRAHYVPRLALLVAGAALELVGRLVKRNVPLTLYQIQSI